MKMTFVVIGIISLITGIVFVYYGYANLNFARSYINPITQNILSAAQYGHFQNVYNIGMKEVAVGSILAIFGLISPVIAIIADRSVSISELEE